MRKLILGYYFIMALILLGENVYSQNSAENNTNTPTEEKDQKYELTASPNPFEDEVTITINEGNKNIIAVRICDIIGKEVAYIDMRNKSGIVSYKLDFSAL